MGNCLLFIKFLKMIFDAKCNLKSVLFQAIEVILGYQVMQVPIED